MIRPLLRHRLATGDTDRNAKGVGRIEHFEGDRRLGTVIAERFGVEGGQSTAPIEGGEDGCRGRGNS